MIPADDDMKSKKVPRTVHLCHLTSLPHTVVSLAEICHDTIMISRAAKNLRNVFSMFRQPALSRENLSKASWRNIENTFPRFVAARLIIISSLSEMLLTDNEYLFLHY